MIRRGAKILSSGLTAALLAAAWAIGGGVPVSPALLARETERAAANARIAVRNTHEAADDTEALATIARNVRAQLAASRLLLDTQLEIERSSRSGVVASRSLTRRVDAIREALGDLERGLREISRLSSVSGATTVATARAAARLDATLGRVKARFDRVVDESRELNRKARAFGRLRP